MPSEVTAGREKVRAVRFTPIEEGGGSRPAFLGGIGRSGLWTCPWGERMGFSEGKKCQDYGHATPLGRKDGLTSVEERKVRSQDTPLGRKDGLQLRKERSGVRIRPWGERIGFSGGKKGQESGYAPGEKG